ncbi:hypothetical protein IC582_011855 [Cucumis melo]
MNFNGCSSIKLWEDTIKGSTRKKKKEKRKKKKNRNSSSSTYEELLGFLYKKFAGYNQTNRRKKQGK